MHQITSCPFLAAVSAHGQGGPWLAGDIMGSLCLCPVFPFRGDPAASR